MKSRMVYLYPYAYVELLSKSLAQHILSQRRVDAPTVYLLLLEAN